MSEPAAAPPAGPAAPADTPPAPPRWLAAIRKVDLAVARVEELALAIMMVALISLAVYQTVKRNFLGGMQAPWVGDAFGHMVFFVGLLGAALAAQSSRMVNIDLLARAFSRRGRLALRVLTSAFTIYMCWLLVRGGLHLRAVNLAVETRGEFLSPRSAALALPVTGILIGLHVALHAAIDVHYLCARTIPPELVDTAPGG